MDTLTSLRLSYDGALECVGPLAKQTSSSIQILVHNHHVNAPKFENPYRHIEGFANYLVEVRHVLILFVIGRES